MIFLKDWSILIINLLAFVTEKDKIKIDNK